MQAAPQQLSPDERALVSDAVGDLTRRTGFPVAFGGILRGGEVAITAIRGARTGALDGLAVRPERGLGGRAITELRPRLASDYRTAKQITHDYDRYILGEGIGTLLAVPVVVAGRARGVLYAAAWSQWEVGGVAAAPAVDVAARLGRRLAELDAQDAAAAEAPPARNTLSHPAPALPPAHQEELRETYAELRRIAASVADGPLRSRLEQVERRLAGLSGMAASASSEEPPVRLSPRETDVLACAALGATNGDIATQLGLREATVKAYLGAAMAKLDVSTRWAAVAKARRAGILP
ncbi:LuxR C-terminal-related transcriptional regulator [Microbacterium oryzae]|uniref:LuxR C-terminal-related transcriptional regulator n=1 Tax=Microbacterium oryzae TaxID=743009 RepID=UPI0025B15223|nr:LuxR C-terminal-related transcriptional regulator [Microbacterium oryzae]MDN3311033.1 LuxR C-terminal-related transcriptional regulator [Microbacterium oryzae]